VKLLIDPDLLDGNLDRRYPSPEALIYLHGATRTVFGYRSTDEQSGPRCPRCNRLEHKHLWQLVDGDGAVRSCEAMS
jgi:hypothetical protein